MGGRSALGLDYFGDNISWRLGVTFTGEMFGKFRNLRSLAADEKNLAWIDRDDPQGLHRWSIGDRLASRENPDPRHDLIITGTRSGPGDVYEIGLSDGRWLTVAAASEIMFRRAFCRPNSYRPHSYSTDPLWGKGQLGYYVNMVSNAELPDSLFGIKVIRELADRSGFSFIPDDIIMILVRRAEKELKEHDKKMVFQYLAETFPNEPVFAAKAAEFSGVEYPVAQVKLRLTPDEMAVLGDQIAKSPAPQDYVADLFVDGGFRAVCVDTQALLEPVDIQFSRLVSLVTYLHEYAGLTHLVLPVSPAQAGLFEEFLKGAPWMYMHKVLMDMNIGDALSLDTEDNQRAIDSARDAFNKIRACGVRLAFCGAEPYVKSELSSTPLEMEQVVERMYGVLKENRLARILTYGLQYSSRQHLHYCHRVKGGPQFKQSPRYSFSYACLLAARCTEGMPEIARRLVASVMEDSERTWGTDATCSNVSAFISANPLTHSAGFTAHREPLGGLIIDGTHSDTYAQAWDGVMLWKRDDRGGFRPRTPAPAPGAYSDERDRSPRARRYLDSVFTGAGVAVARETGSSALRPLARGEQSISAAIVERVLLQYEYNRGCSDFRRIVRSLFPVISAENQERLCRAILQAVECNQANMTHTLAVLADLLTREAFLVDIAPGGRLHAYTDKIIEILAIIPERAGYETPKAIETLASLLTNKAILTELGEGGRLEGCADKIFLFLAEAVQNLSSGRAIESIQTLTALLRNRSFFDALGQLTIPADRIFSFVSALPEKAGSLSPHFISIISDLFSDEVFLAAIRDRRVKEYYKNLKTMLVEREVDKELSWGYGRAVICALFNPTMLDELIEEAAPFGSVIGETMDHNIHVAAAAISITSGLYFRSGRVVPAGINAPLGAFGMTSLDISARRRTIDGLLPGAGDIIKIGRRLKREGGTASIKFLYRTEDMAAFAVESNVLALSRGQKGETHPLHKISANDALRSGVVSADDMRDYFQTDDGCLLCITDDPGDEYYYAYGIPEEDAKAKLGIPGQSVLTANDAILLAGNLGRLAGEKGIVHIDLLPLFHHFSPDQQERRRYRINAEPPGCIDNISGHALHANLRLGGHVADLNPSHLRIIPPEGLNPFEVSEVVRLQLFQWILFVADRFEQQEREELRGIPARSEQAVQEVRIAWNRSFERVLKEGIEAYFNGLLGSSVDYGHIDHVWFAEYILNGFRHKQKAVGDPEPRDLGQENGSLSISKMLDLCDYLGLKAAQHVIKRNEVVPVGGERIAEDRRGPAAILAGASI
ncbi:MAG: hypothetical protein WCG78_03980 [Candidatus Omnitrophota bacterium]